MRGLDPDEVYAFLATVAEEYEAVLNDNKALRERLLELDDKVQEYRTMEKTLRDTLLTAERVTVEAKDNARREASIIVKEAQIEAEKALRDIKNESMKLRQQVSFLRSQRDAYLAKMRLVAESHLDFLRTGFDDFSDEDGMIDEVVPKSVPAAPPAPKSAPEKQNLFDAKPASTPAPDASNQVDTVPIPIPGAPAPEKSESVPAYSPPPAPPAPAMNPVDPAPRAEAPAPATNSTSDSLADISVIIERMRATQQEVVAGSQTPPSEGSWKQIVDDSAPTMTAVEPTPVPAPVVKPAPVNSPTDVTSEFNLDEIRREIGHGVERDPNT